MSGGMDQSQGGGYMANPRWYDQSAAAATDTGTATHGQLHQDYYSMAQAMHCAYGNNNLAGTWI